MAITWLRPSSLVSDSETAIAVPTRVSWADTVKLYTLRTPNRTARALLARAFCCNGMLLDGERRDAQSRRLRRTAYAPVHTLVEATTALILCVGL